MIDPDSTAVLHRTGSGAAAPLVTVVVTSRDRERYLPAALASLAAQTYPRIEVIAVDDGSSDGTGRILEAFAASRPHVRVLHTEGIGPAAARALAFESARGELFAIQDDDDVSRPERIERQVRHLLEHPELALLGTAAEIIDADGNLIGPYPVPLEDRGIRKYLRRRSPFVHGTVVMRREAYRAAGGYRAAFAVAEDFDLYLRLAIAGRLANLPDPLYRWRHHDGNTLERRESEHFFFVAAARAFVDERRATGRDSADLLEQCAHREAFLARYPRAGRLMTYMGEAYSRVGRTPEAWRYLMRALRRPGSRARALAWAGLSLGVALLRRTRGPSTRGGLMLPGRRR